MKFLRRRSWDSLLLVSDPSSSATDPSFVVDVDDSHVARERAKARELRQSQWWKRRRSAGVCHWCGERFAPRELTMDHVVPIIRGGTSTKGNVVAACKACNTDKKHRLAWER
jgi:5-methylcytosine-specific restriction endonuclease McrA